MNWRDQVLLPTREVGRVFLAAEHGRFCVRVLRAEADVVVVISDAETVSDADVSAGTPAAVVECGPPGLVLYALSRGANRYGASTEEISSLRQVVSDAQAEIELRRETLREERP